MSYTLTDVQEEFFDQICNIHNPENIAKDGATKRVTGVRYDRTADETSVPCRFMPSTEQLSPAPMGRSDYDIVATTDIIRLPVGVVVRSGAYIQQKTPGNPELDTWYVALGEPWSRTFMANTKYIYLKKATTPPYDD